MPSPADPSSPPAAATARPTVALHRLKRGQSGHVERVSLPASQALRLSGLGLCEGRLIEVISTGDPAIVRVCGSTLAVGRALAKGVEMCVCETSTCPHESSKRSLEPSAYTASHTDADRQGGEA